MKQFHISLEAGDIGETVILPGDPARSKKIASGMDKYEFVAECREYTTYTGTTGGVKVSVMSTGIGCPSVAIGVEELANIGARNLIRLGTTGALQPEIEPGSLIVATGAVRGDGTTPEYVPIEFPAIADREVVNALIEGCESVGVTPYAGIIRSHDAFYVESAVAHPGWEERLKVWTKAGCLSIENESSALFVVGSLRKLRTGTILVVRANHITKKWDKVDPEVDEALDKAIKASMYAARKLAAVK